MENIYTFWYCLKLYENSEIKFQFSNLSVGKYSLKYASLYNRKKYESDR